MHLTTRDNIAAMDLSGVDDLALFSMAETELNYIVAVDIPAVPNLDMEILSSKGQLVVEGRSENSKSRQTILRLLPRGSGIETIYKDGVLWILLPKNRKNRSQSPLSWACI